MIAFGKARILEDETERRKALQAVAERYSPKHTQARMEEIEKALKQVCLLELTIEHMSGKEAKELAKAKAKENK